MEIKHLSTTMLNKEPHDICLEIGFNWPPNTPEAFPGLVGGIRITADGKLLNGRLHDAAQGTTDDPLYDATGTPINANRWEFVGDNHYDNLPAIQDAITPLMNEEYDRYREYPAELWSAYGNTVIVFSPLNGDLIRMAVQPIEYEQDEWDRPIEGLVGVAIAPSNLCHELISCYEQCIRYVRAAYEDQDVDLSDEIDDLETEFRDRIAALKSHID